MKRLNLPWVSKMLVMFIVLYVLYNVFYIIEGFDGGTLGKVLGGMMVALFFFGVIKMIVDAISSPSA